MSIQLSLWDAPAIHPRRKANPVKAECDRLIDNKERLLARMKAGPITTPELHDPRWGCSGDRRLRELRARGWDIEKARVTAGIYRYTLTGFRGQPIPVDVRGNDQ